MKQGLNLLDRVMQFYPLMQEGDASQVTLTEQDWLVLMDFTENPESKELLPPKVKDIVVDRASRTINITTDDCKVEVKMGF
jgi:hypothetical protein